MKKELEWESRHCRQNFEKSLENLSTGRIIFSIFKLQRTTLKNYMFTFILC